MNRFRNVFVACGPQGGRSDDAGAQRGGAEKAKLREIGELFHDAALTTQARSALASSVGGTHAARIEVDTRRAVVTLTGEVETPDIRVRADQAAIGVEGVRSVVDNLVVRSPAIG